MSFLKKFASNKLGVLTYKGTWDADSNSPELLSGIGVAGNYYVVSQSGTTNIDGITSWDAGDWVIFNGSVWQRLDVMDKNSIESLDSRVSSLEASSSAVSGLVTDLDAAAYIAAVESADGEPLEPNVKYAINAFFLGCKADQIWDSITSGCILVGARTLAGALVPIKGAAPTSYNFVSADYTRLTGLKGNGSSKYLDSNVLANSFAYDNRHISAFVQDRVLAGGYEGALLGARTVSQSLLTVNTSFFNANLIPPTTIATPTLVGVSRSGNTVTHRANNVNTDFTSVNNNLEALSYHVLSRHYNGSPSLYGAHRVKFYSIGDSIDLAALDLRLTRLMAEIEGSILY